MKTSIDFLETDLAYHCNIKCKYCDHFSPLASPYVVDIVDFEKDMKKLSELTNKNIKRIKLLGGEPLLNPNAGDCAMITRKYFPDTAIWMVTNGFLLKKMNDSFWENIIKSDTMIYITLYFKYYNYDNMFDYIYSKGVPSGNVRIHGRIPQLFVNIALSLESEFEPQYSFENCYQSKGCNYLKNGVLYPCPIAGNADVFKKYFKIDDDTISLSKNDGINIHDVKSGDDLFKFLSNHIPFCKYCDVDKRINPSFEYEHSQYDIKEWVL